MNFSPKFDEIKFDEIKFWNAVKNYESQEKNEPYKIDCYDGKIAKLVFIIRFEGGMHVAIRDSFWLNIIHIENSVITECESVDTSNAEEDSYYQDKDETIRILSYFFPITEDIKEPSED